VAIVGVKNVVPDAISRLPILREALPHERMVVSGGIFCDTFRHAESLSGDTSSHSKCIYESEQKPANERQLFQTWV